MIIKNSSIGMDSARTYTSVDMKGYRTSGRLIAFPGILSDAFDAKSKPDVSKTDESEKDSEKKETATDPRGEFDSVFGRMRALATSEAYESKLQRDAMTRIRIECIQFLIYMLFGGKKTFEDMPVSEEEPGHDMIASQITESYMYYRSETEETSFSTTGKVVTEDGRELSFDLELTMSRSFTQYYESNITKVTAFTDPLVINLDVPVAEVSDVRVAFDLDCDGSEDGISVLSKGSGYLAYDKNEDGVINDGSELFGTSSGNGFSDLADYDSDGNGWIDEADEIFDRLVVTFFEEDGSSTLVKLKDLDIGAICTKSASTDFSLNDLSTNETRARIRQTGIFLYESGMMGTVQHLDLAQ